MGVWDHPKHVRVLAKGSITISVLLVLSALALPNFPLAPLIVLNWILFMSTGITSWKAISAAGGISDWKRDKRYQLFNLVLIVFALAGWIAIGSGAPIA
jgi:hypothetical protein